jgi:hypothetical protein
MGPWWTTGGSDRKARRSLALCSLRGGILTASWGKEGEDDGEPHQGLQRLPWQQRWPGDDEEQAVAVELGVRCFWSMGRQNKGRHELWW